jgi:hypothetical protein
MCPNGCSFNGECLNAPVFATRDLLATIAAFQALLFVIPVLYDY